MWHNDAKKANDAIQPYRGRAERARWSDGTPIAADWGAAGAQQRRLVKRGSARSARQRVVAAAAERARRRGRR